eukprot:10510084-Karenia_brevis.AAC.1
MKARTFSLLTCNAALLNTSARQYRRKEKYPKRDTRVTSISAHQEVHSNAKSLTALLLIWMALCGSSFQDAKIQIQEVSLHGYPKIFLQMTLDQEL